MKDLVKIFGEEVSAEDLQEIAEQINEFMGGSARVLVANCDVADILNLFRDDALEIPADANPLNVHSEFVSEAFH